VVLIINKSLTNDYLVKKSFNSFLVYSIITTLSASLGMIVDGLVISNFLGNDQMAAFGLSTPFLLIPTAIISIIGGGSSIIVSHCIGKGDKEKANAYFTLAIILSLLIGLIISISSPFIVNYVAIVLGAKGNLISYSSGYMLGILIGTIPWLISEVLYYFTQIDGAYKLTLFSTGIMTAVNVSLDLLFVLYFGLDIFSIGIATTISYLVGVLIILTHFFSKKTSFHLTKFNDKNDIISIVQLGLPMALKSFYSTIRIYINNTLAIWVGGTLVMGALSIQANANLLFTAIPTGIGAANVLLGGIFYGEQDRNALKDTLKTSIKYGIIIMSVVMIIILLFAEPITMFFGSEEKTLRTVALSYRFLALSLPLSAISVCFLSYYNSIKKTYYANYIVFGHKLLFIVIFSLCLTPLIGQNGIWSCFLFGEITTLIGLLLLIRIKEGYFPKSLDDFLLLDDEFEKDIIGNYSISIKNNINEAIGLSEEISKFGEKHGYDYINANKVALCIEEMACNIIQHGFKDKKKHYIDIRIILTKDDLILRVRDNGIPFNPIEYMNHTKNPEDAIGIYMVQQISKKMDYRNTIGLNNLNIKI